MMLKCLFDSAGCDIKPPAKYWASPSAVFHFDESFCWSVGCVDSAAERAEELFTRRISCGGASLGNVGERPGDNEAGDGRSSTTKSTW